MDKLSKKNLALERIDRLFGEAEHSVNADRYVDLARKIAMKARISIPKKHKIRYCSHCYKYIHPEKARVRSIKGKIIYHCGRCGRVTRFGFRRDKIDKKGKSKGSP